jgi:phage terminase large subunit-like protein
MMIFRPKSSILLVSRREEESKYLLSEERLKGMYKRLPNYFKIGLSITSDSKLKFSLSNGSVIRALSSGTGDSYTGQLVLADEFDLVQDQQKLLLAVRPVVSAGGKLLLISKSNKTQPMSPFKGIYRSGKRGDSPWTSLFYPWYARPDRTKEWYEDMVAESIAQTGTMDAVYENFPATDEEALKPYEQDKRFPYNLIKDCHIDKRPIINNSVFIQKLKVYKDPEPKGKYVIGVDPAEGNVNSDYSAALVMDKDSGEEVALYKEKIEISDFGRIVEQLALAYNNAGVLVERNNHGHALILWLRENTNITLLRGPDGKFGYVENAKTKAQLFSDLANDFMNMQVTIYSDDTFAEVSNISGSKMKAPEGLHDDCAIAFALAAWARRKKGKRKTVFRGYSYRERRF